MPQQRSVLLFYLGILRRRVWVVLPVFVVIATIGFLNALKAPEVFKATCRILVERNTGEVMSFEERDRDGYGREASFYETQIQLLRSRAVIETAMGDSRLEPVFRAGETKAGPTGPRAWLAETKRTILSLLGTTPSAPMEPWERLREKVVARHVPDTHFLLVEVMSRSPMHAALMANAAAEGYRKYHRGRRAATLSESFLALQAEKEKQELQLLAAEKELQEFRETAEGVSVSEEDRPAIERLGRLNDQLTEVQLKRIELSSQLGVMQEALVADGRLSEETDRALFSLPVIQSDTTLVENRRALAVAERRAASLSETYGAQHPQLAAARAQVGVSLRQFKGSLKEVIEAHANRRRMLETEEAELKSSYEEQKRLALSLAKESFTYARLHGAVNRHRRLFDAIVDRMREVDISSGLIKTDVEIVEEAAMPRLPMSAGRTRRIVISSVLGLFLGIGLAFLFESLDDTVKTPEDLLERLDVPLLGFVPSMANETPRRKGKDREGPEGSIRLAALEKPQDSQKGRLYAERGSMVLSEPISSVAEAYRSIRTSLFYATPADEIKVLAVTSCRPQEGKTTTVTNLALSVSRTGKKVLLVDGDLHRPMTHHLLGVRSSTGLSSVLAGECDWREAIQDVITEDGTPMPNLHVLLAGRPSPSPSELLGSRKMSELLAEWRGEYDWVFVDTPPVLFVSDASILSTMCDGVVLIVRAGASTRALLGRAKGQLASVNARIIGSILNGMVVSRMGRHYSYYHYHGYSRYSKDYHRSYYPDDSGGGDEDFGSEDTG